MGRGGSYQLHPYMLQILKNGEGGVISLTPLHVTDIEEWGGGGHINYTPTCYRYGRMGRGGIISITPLHVTDIEEWADLMKSYLSR